MSNYAITSTAQTLDDIMGADYDNTKTYSLHINQCAPAVLSVIPATKTGSTVDPYDGSAGKQYKEFSDISGITNGEEIYFKSTSNDINVFIEEVTG